MDSLFKTIRSGIDGHPSEDALLLHVDGEPSSKAVTTVRSHLDACWSCRVRTEKIEETISTFIDYRNQVLKPLATPPPKDWRGFDGRLKGLVSQIGRPSVFANLRGALGRAFFIPNVSLNVGFLMRPIAVTLIAALLVTVFLRFNRTSIVSASEMLHRATDAQQLEISKTPQAVIYQKLQVKRRVESSSTSETVTCEVWNDTVNSRVRRSIEDATGRHFLNDEAKGRSTTNVSASPAQNATTLTQLSSVLQSNHMNPAMPLSAASYEAWSRSAEQKHEEVTKTGSSGHETLTLRTTVIAPATSGAITEASLVVRASDWHPIEERLRVKSYYGDEEYELTEAVYSVVSLNTLSPEIFTDQPVVGPTPTSNAAAEKEAEDSLSPLTPRAAPVIASADLEVEVLRLLNQAGADLGEQISATRHSDGLVHVEGVVATPQRKAEVLRALEPVTTNPAVKIEIQTVAEAVAEQQQQRSRAKATAAPVNEQRVEIESETIAAAPELRRHFSNDEQMREFAARMVTQSRSAMHHVYAMKRLVGQFSPDELRTLTPEAKNKWLALIRSHARDYQNDAETLRRELQPIFFASSSSPGASGPEITDDASLARAVEQLFSLASANDGVIRSAFVTSSENSVTSAISSPEFWRSLTSAEGLAGNIANHP